MNYTRYVSVKFLTELIAMVALYVLPYRRRPQFLFRLPLCLILCYAFSYISSPVMLRYHLWAEPAASIMDIARYIIIVAIVAMSVHLLFELSLRSAFFVCSGAYAIQHIALKIYGLAEALYVDRVPLRVLALLYVAFIVLFYAAAYFLVVRRVHREDTVRLKANQTFLFNVMSVVSFIVLNRLSQSIESLAAVGRIAIAGYGIICGVFMLLLQMNIFEKNAIERENEKTEFILEQERKRFESFREAVDYLNIKCHDLKYQIHQLKASTAVSADAITELEDSVAQYESYTNIGFPALDIVLGEKALVCRAKGIEFNAQVEGKQLARLSEPDIYALFGNALDNAIEYEETLPDGDRLIRLAVKDVGDILFIRVENTYAGEDFQNGNPQSTKGDDTNHGFGLKSMRLIAEKYDGEMDVSASDGLFSLTFMFMF